MSALVFDYMINIIYLALGHVCVSVWMGFINLMNGWGFHILSIHGSDWSIHKIAHCMKTLVCFKSVCH